MRAAKPAAEFGGFNARAVAVQLREKKVEAVNFRTRVAEDCRGVMRTLVRHAVGSYFKNALEKGVDPYPGVKRSREVYYEEQPPVLNQWNQVLQPGVPAQVERKVTHLRNAASIEVAFGEPQMAEAGINESLRAQLRQGLDDKKILDVLFKELCGKPEEGSLKDELDRAGWKVLEVKRGTKKGAPILEVVIRDKNEKFLENELPNIRREVFAGRRKQG